MMHIDGLQLYPVRGVHVYSIVLYGHVEGKKWPLWDETRVDSQYKTLTQKRFSLKARKKLSKLLDFLEESERLSF